MSSDRLLLPSRRRRRAKALHETCWSSEPPPDTDWLHGSTRDGDMVRERLAFFLNVPQTRKKLRRRVTTIRLRSISALDAMACWLLTSTATPFPMSASAKQSKSCDAN